MSRLDLPSRATLPRDLLAGLTVGASQVGNAMAYTILAGVPPVHGLYAAMVGTPVGALTASSQRMAIVPTAALCLAAGGALAGLPSEQRVAGLLVLTVTTGVLMLVAGLLRAGSLVRFISNAVMVGFMLGVAVQIVLGQMLALAGFSSTYTNKVAKVADMAAHIGDIDVPTTLVGVATILLIVLISRTRLKLFAMVTALVVVTAIVALLGLASVAVVGDIAPIPNGFPRPRLPELSLAPRLLLPAVSLAIIGLVQGAGVGRAVPNADGSLGDASRDFVGQGVANVAAGFFGGVTVGGSVQATALNVGAGSRTRWSAFFAGVVVIVIVLAAAPLVRQVPLAVTAGILIVAAVSAIRPRAAREIWSADRLSAAVMAVTFVLVLVIPLQYAVLAGAAISVLKYIYLASLDVRVVQIAIGDDGRPREARGPRTLSDSSVTVLDIYGSLFFAAGPKVRDCLPAVGGARCAVVVLRLRGRGTLHSTTIALIRDYAAELAAGGGRLYLAGVGAEMEDQLGRTGLRQTLGADAVLPATDELYGSCEAAQRRGRAWLEAHPDGRAAASDAPRTAPDE
ncbi:MAG: SulP family inorganic anion transporter [Actinomycetes bacterium]